MKQIAVISGKGGTGKTSIVAAFAVLAKDLVLADCDVDASDLHLLLEPTLEERAEFRAGYEPDFDPEKCTGCGECVRLCRFDAVHLDAESGLAKFDFLACEGCGVCEDVCPAEAVKMRECVAGESYRSSTRYGTLFHARLGIGGEMSGKLASSIRMKTEEYAKKTGAKLILIDGSPGVGCPVIASLAGVDAALVVTEPTLSGLHDMERVLDLCTHFKIPSIVLINKSDLNPDVAEQIKESCKKRGAHFAGEIPFDRAFTDAMMARKTIIEYDNGPSAERVKTAWEQVQAACLQK